MGFGVHDAIDTVTRTTAMSDAARVIVRGQPHSRVCQRGDRRLLVNRLLQPSNTLQDALITVGIAGEREQYDAGRLNVRA